MDTSTVIKIRKGCNISIPGTAQKQIADFVPTEEYAIKPTDYVGVAPRVLVAEGDEVAAGTPLFEDKNNEGIPFVSPVNGIVKAIVRGEKRALLAVVVKEKRETETAESKTGINELQGNDVESIRNKMMESGLWNLLRQRPFGIVPRKGSRPKATFISAFDSSPLPVDIDFMMQGRMDDFQCGIDVLAQIGGPVHIALNGSTQRDSILAKTRNASIHFFEGPHPAGLTGTHIAYISPINKGETVWTVNMQDVATIGHLFRTGEYRPERIVALCGPCVENPQYYRITEGLSIDALQSLLIQTPSNENGSGCPRIICGNVLSGTSVDANGFVSASCDKISVIPEGNYYDFLGWLRPNFRKYSFSRTFLSGMLSKFKIQNSKLDFDTGRHGSVRPLFVTGEFEKLVPIDIYPMQLIKACIANDIEQMENLGIYEVEPEDLALCEFADTSKTEIQAIIRDGLEKTRKEVS